MAATVVRKYRKSHIPIMKGPLGILEKPCIEKKRQGSAFNMAQGLSMEIVSVMYQKVRRTLQEVKL